MQRRVAAFRDELALRRILFIERAMLVPWIHPSKGDNLSGMDIWDHVWSEQPKESEWFD